LRFALFGVNYFVMEALGKSADYDNADIRGFFNSKAPK
jgi:hypothetical protein